MAVGVFDHCRKIAPGDVLQAQSETSILKSLLKTGFSDQQLMDSIGRDLFHYQDCTAKFGSLSNGMADPGRVAIPFSLLPAELRDRRLAAVSQLNGLTAVVSCRPGRTRR